MWGQSWSKAARPASVAGLLDRLGAGAPAGPSREGYGRDVDAIGRSPEHRGADRVGGSATDPATFTQVVDKVAGVYFSVTVLATVGFGDISAVSDLARIMVTVQMIIDLVLIGVTVKLLGTVARRAVEARLALGPGEPVERDPGAAGLVEPQER